MFQKQQRIGLVIYLYYNRDARKLMKYGDLYYHSKRSRYLIIYINKEDMEEKLKDISRLTFVKEVKASVFDDIDCDFVGNLHREPLEIQALPDQD
ncbi:TPA: YlbG family protein [Streptococcus equi subsp. zooepidemicus]|uniref:YlbG family protein n=1 Tax=Streptococcus equi TaxID=1336 RepID=UPI001E38E483|nr:YlbG family protein [Streptococcus equi]MCD3415597.1 YlbG family protein [Streptococcus equi subsp. zooepidemicus]HEL0589370.1 YlbG family protein [Streptococcus equi subsp. zooepidemicus]HEL1145904.1 YlbG family protein [Streptococcus equi subsp. zooepidemicus]HEL1536236.1 YlbG family protein [Streptococcus equi subsp. zooepidemicus]